MKKDFIKTLISESTTKVTINGNEFINLAELGKTLRDKSINIGKARQFFEAHPDDFEVYVDKSQKTAVVYVRTKEPAPDSVCDRQGNKDMSISKTRIGGKGNSIIRHSDKTPLEDWAYLSDINETLDKLAKKARKEDWSYSNGKPNYPKHPILYLYLRYTFCRLQHQNKIKYSIDGQWAAWNTGLVDHRFEPIIALFHKNRQGLRSEWIFSDFVIEGESSGKIISNLFEGTIERATFSEDWKDMMYDETLGMPSLDFEHILKRLDRIPDRFWQVYAPKGFDVKTSANMTYLQSVEYFGSLREKIMNDSTAYRQIIKAFQNSLELAMKRIAWNSRTAVPMYYPKDNRLCLLIPLCLVDEDMEDVALVVKRTPAGKYDGATIITLDMAYADSRVVQCPTSDWLVSSKIEGSGETLI